MKTSWTEGNVQSKRVVAGLLVVACSTLAACALPTGNRTAPYVGTGTDAGIGGRAVVSRGNQSDANVVSVVWKNKLEYVRIERVDGIAESRNSHPVNLSPQEIRVALSEIQVRRDKKPPKPMFETEELNRIAGPISKALAEAGPREDVTFAVMSKKGFIGLINPQLVTTGRVFYTGRGLNVIFGLVHREYEDQFKATGYLKAFTPGSRSTQRKADVVVVPARYMEFTRAGRSDWIEIDPQAWSGMAGAQAAASPEPSVSTEPAPTAAEPFSASPAAGSAETQALNTAPSGAAAAVVVDPGAPRDGGIEERLETLKRLYEKELITEPEYQEKRRAILEDL